jgi:hypothetical protein
LSDAGAALKAALHSSLPSDLLAKALESVLGENRNFVVTWDFRGVPPSGSWTKGLAKFCDAHRSRLSALVKSAAVLIEDNIFVAATMGLVGGFVEACMPGCPFLVCHGEAAAEEFFHAHASAFVQCSPFVTVVDVKSARCSGSLQQNCVASLAPSGTPSCNGKWKGHTEAPQTFHMLPNGDVRVIQSPPPDIVIGRALANAAALGEEPVDGVVKPPHLGTVCSGGDLPAVSALMFKGPKEALQQMIGVHFHIGELVIDAEVESVSRHGVGGLRGSAVGCSCFTAGIRKIVNEMLERIISERKLV